MKTLTSKRVIQYLSRLVSIVRIAITNKHKCIATASRGFCDFLSFVYIYVYRYFFPPLYQWITGEQCCKFLTFNKYKYSGHLVRIHINVFIMLSARRYSSYYFRDSCTIRHRRGPSPFKQDDRITESSSDCGRDSIITLLMSHTHYTI